MNPIKTPQQMLLEQAGIPHLAGGKIVSKELSAGAQMLFDSAIKKFKAITGRAPTANEVAQLQEHAASLSKPTTQATKLSPSAQEANAQYQLAKNPNYAKPEDLRDPFVVRQMMPGRTKAGTAQPTLTESIQPTARGDIEGEAKALTGELQAAEEPTLTRSVERDMGSFDPLAGASEDTPISQIKWAPSTTPSADYFSKLADAQIQKALGEKAIGKKQTVYEMLKENFAKEHGRYPTADELDQLIVKYNPARHPYGESELTRYESGEGLDLLSSRPKTARGMEEWRQSNRELGVPENYLQKQVDKYPKEYQDALKILSGELPFSKTPTPRKKKAAPEPTSTHLDEEGNIVKSYPANKKAGGSISAERMRHAMLANGKTPQHFAGGAAVRNIAGNAGLTAALTPNEFLNLAKQTKHEMSTGKLGSGLNSAFDLASMVSPYFLVPNLYQAGRGLSGIATEQLARNEAQRKQMQSMASTPLGGALGGDDALAAAILGNRDYSGVLEERNAEDIAAQKAAEERAYRQKVLQDRMQSPVIVNPSKLR